MSGIQRQEIERNTNLITFGTGLINSGRANSSVKINTIDLARKTLISSDTQIQSLSVTGGAAHFGSGSRLFFSRGEEGNGLESISRSLLHRHLFPDRLPVCKQPSTLRRK